MLFGEIGLPSRVENTSRSESVLLAWRFPVSGAPMLARYRELVRNPDFVELPDIGQDPQVEDPAAVLKAFLEFHAGLSVVQR